MEKEVKFEVSPQLPTSGQILGFLVKNLGLYDYRLRSKTARRFFSGRLDDIVKDSSRSEIIEAISEALAELGFQADFRTSEEPSASALAPIIDWHAVHWDRTRTFLLPRMSRVYSSNLTHVWQTYLRLSVIDLAFRVAAYLRLTDRPQTTLDFLEWTSVDGRCAYLNEKRRRAKITLFSFAESMGMSQNSVEGWVYRGVRPSDENLAKIAAALSSTDDPDEREWMLRDLRLLYWIGDIVGILGKHIGTDAVGDTISHLHKYATHVYRSIEEESVVQLDPTSLAELVTQGSRSTVALPLLTELIREESDGEWREDLSAAGSDWIGRVLSVNFQVHRAEEDALIEDTDGQVLKRWDIGNPQAYEHYRRSHELQMQGRIYEAVAELVKAIQLDPLDPANHFTLGSVKGDIGMRNGDEVLVNEGLDSCWMAVSLDPSWILPWTEIGWLLLGSDMTKEAVEHLQGVRPECRPLDSNYYNALGYAHGFWGELDESLAAFESSLELNPDDPRIAADAAVTALQVGDTLKSNRYLKMARHLGISRELERSLDLVKAGETDLPIVEIAMLHDQKMAALNVAIARRPDDATAYLSRARAHFVEGADAQTISDLNAVIRLDPDNTSAHVLRGIVYGYMGKYELAIADTSEAIRLNPGDAKAHYYRGLAHGEQDAFDFAIADLSEVVRLSPCHGDAYRKRGDSYLYKKDYDSAIADYETALRLDAGDAAAYRGRGAAFRMKGDLDSAIADYDIAVSLNPNDPFAYRFRGDAYLAKRDYARAVADFNAALKIDRTDEAANLGRGNAHLFNGELDSAIADFDLAVECNPASALAHYGRGLTREALGDTEEAEYDFRRARELGYDDSV